MGTLRIKRGTKTQLQTTPGYTPAEGELVYTTDSKEVFVGDGSTTGGIPVSVSTQNLEDLGNVQALTPQKDQILVYNGSNWAATANPALDLRGNIYGDDSTLLVDAVNGQIVGPINTSSIISSGNIVGDLVGDVTGSVTGNVVGDTTGTHFGDVTGSVLGDVKGSVFADDSAIMVDAVNNVIVANRANFGTTMTDTIEPFTEGTDRIDFRNMSQLFVVSESATGFGLGLVNIQNVHENQYTNDLNFTRQRGTELVPTTINANDKLGGISFTGYDGSARLQGALIGSFASAISSGNISANLAVYTRDGGQGTLTKCADFTADKKTKTDKLENLYAGNDLVVTIDGGGYIHLNNALIKFSTSLPTSDPGVPGALWNDLGTLRISL